MALVLLSAALAATGCPSEDGGGSGEGPVTAVKGAACGYFVNVGLFGGPLNLRGCGQTANAPGAVSPSVTLPAGGSATAIIANDPDGAAAQYGPAVIYGGRWPEEANTAPPSGPMSVSTQGTPEQGVTSSTDIVLRTPPNPLSPGGFGPMPVEGDEMHVSCTANRTATTGTTRIVKGVLSLTTDAGGSPKDSEPIPENPPVNYTRSGVISNVGDVFTAVFNEQIVNPDGSLTVNGVHMYLFGPTAVGEMVKGQVTCGTTPSALEPKDTTAPSCGPLVVEPVGPEDPTPKVPRRELVGVFDTGGIQEVTNIEVTNGTVDTGTPGGAPHLQLRPGQTGPLPMTATRSPQAESAGLPLSWSFEVTDVAGNTIRCPTARAPDNPLAGGTSTTTR